MRAFLNVEQLESRDAPAAFDPVADLPRPTIVPKLDDPVYVRYSGMTDAEINRARQDISDRIDRYERDRTKDVLPVTIFPGFVQPPLVGANWVVKFAKMHGNHADVVRDHHEINVIIFVRWERSQGR